MESKHKHWLIIAAVVVGVLVLSVPLLFQDIEVIPYLWLSNRLPAAPEIPKKPHFTDLKVSPIIPAKVGEERVWVVRIQQVNTKEQAEALVQQLNAEHVPAFLPLDLNEKNIVLLGPWLEYAQAQQQLNQLPSVLQDNANVEIFSLPVNEDKQ